MARTFTRAFNPSILAEASFATGEPGGVNFPISLGIRELRFPPVLKLVHEMEL
jgi:hypothetical protein